MDFNCVPFLLYPSGFEASTAASDAIVQLMLSKYLWLTHDKILFPWIFGRVPVACTSFGLDSHRLRSGTMPGSRHTALASLAYLSTSAVPCLMTPSGYYVPSDSQFQLPAAQPVPDSELLSWLHDAIPPTMHEHLVPVVWNRNPQSRISLMMMAAVLCFVRSGCRSIIGIYKAAGMLEYHSLYPFT